MINKGKVVNPTTRRWRSRRPFVYLGPLTKICFLLFFMKTIIRPTDKQWYLLIALIYVNQCLSGSEFC
jgi:Na+/melibiose symporter-like transporter